MKILKSEERKSKRRLLQWAGTIVTLSALIFLISQQGWGEIASAVSQISVWHLGSAVVLMLCSRLAVAMRWYILVKAIEPQVSFKNLAQVTFAGLFASNFLPSTIGGDVVRLVGVMQYSISSAGGAASLLIDRLVGILSMLIMIPFAGKVTIKEIFGQTVYGPVLVYGLLGNFKLKEIFGRFYKWIIDTLKTCSLWYEHPLSISGAFFFNALHMISLFGTLGVIVSGLGDYLPLWKLGALWSIVYFITLVPISINGYGLQEISVAFVLTHWGNMSSSHSITVALMIRMMFVLLSLPGAAFLPKLISRLDKRR